MGLVIYYFNINAACFLSGYVSFSVSILLYIYFVLIKSTLAIVIVILKLAAEILIELRKTAAQPHPVEGFPKTLVRTSHFMTHVRS